MDNWNPIRDWHAGQLAIAESRAVHRARWSRVRLYAWTAVAFVLAFLVWCERFI